MCMCICGLVWHGQVQQLVNLASVDEDLLAGAELDGLDTRCGC